MDSSHVCRVGTFTLMVYSIYSREQNRLPVLHRAVLPKGGFLLRVSVLQGSHHNLRQSLRYIMHHFLAGALRHGYQLVRNGGNARIM